MTDFVLASPKPRVRVPAGRSVVTKSEGEFRPGPWFLPVTGGWLSNEAGSNWNWWQNGWDIEKMGPSAMVEACVSAYSQTVAMCPGDHWKINKETNGRDRVTNSALSRILKSPNAYQTISDFLLNAVRNVYEDGNAYALALRNNRFEIEELHLMNPRSSVAQVAYNGEIFYGLAGNIVIERMFDYPFLVPARDVLHIKLNTNAWNPLLGESPIIAAARDIASLDAMAMQQISFYLNQARPSTVLSTEMLLEAKQVEDIRERWNEQTRGLKSGGTPILTANLKPVSLSTNAVDSQLAQIMKMNEQNIALAYRIPLAILGMGGGGVGTTESLMQGWLAGALGFCLNHVEEAFGKLFGLVGQPDEYLELNTSVLLRSAFKDRMEGLSRGTLGGIISPDEARETEGYPKVPGGFGEEPRVQQQVVPLSAAAAIPAAPASPPQPPAAAVPGPNNDVAASKGISDGEKDRVRKRFRSSHSRQQLRYSV